MGDAINKMVGAVDKFISHDEAFGLPPGTIRGTVLLILTITVCYLSVREGKMSETLSTAFGLAVGYYFGKLDKQGGPPTQGQVQPSI